MNATLHRLMGGSPGAVIVKLVFLSLLVGALLALFDITPGDLLRRAVMAVQAVFDLGFQTFHEAGRWFLAGAAIVVPLWLLSRLFGATR